MSYDFANTVGASFENEVRRRREAPKEKAAEVARKRRSAVGRV